MSRTRKGERKDEFLHHINVCQTAKVAAERILWFTAPGETPIIPILSRKQPNWRRRRCERIKTGARTCSHHWKLTSGWTAAIYAARASLKPLVFEGAVTEENRLKGTLPLGQLANTTEVENYPGFPPGDLSEYFRSSLNEEHHWMIDMHQKEGCSGPELMHLMRQQATNFGTRVITDDIVEVDFDSHPFKLKSMGGEEVEALSVIVATGASANYLGLPSEETYKNNGVSACAVCDGALPRFRDKPLVVVGGGDSAVEEADYLAKFASTVHLVHRRDELRASKIMAQRAIDHPKIEIEWNSVVDEILGNETDGVTAVRAQINR